MSAEEGAKGCGGMGCGRLFWGEKELGFRGPRRGGGGKGVERRISFEVCIYVISQLSRAWGFWCKTC